MNNSENPNQGNAPKKRRKSGNPIVNTLLYLVMILLISGLLASAVIVLGNDLFALTKPDKEIEVTIPEDASIGEVSKILSKSGVIDHKLFFQLFVTMTNRHSQFYDGTFELNSSMDYREILSNIRMSRYSTVKVTIPEGYTVEQIKQTVLDAGLSSKKEMTAALESGEFDCDYLPDDLGSEENRLEGYLFPDTYEFYLSDSAETIIQKMLDNYTNKVESDAKRKSLVAVAKKRGVSMRDALIVASMIEKEAASDDEMKDIAGVIYNRLNDTTDFPYLNIDATIQYVCGHTGALTEDDLKIDSPYNTYTNKGLPPGPICNPGYSALYAALHPSEHNYYYYVANADGTAHIFSTTLEEHNQAVAEVEQAKGN